MLTNGELDADCFKPLLQPVASLWIVGEIIAGVAEFRTGKGLAPLASAGRILFGDRPRTYDDFRWHDPLPLLMELIHYGSSFLASGGNLNPVAIEMYPLNTSGRTTHSGTMLRHLRCIVERFTPDY